MFWDGVVDVFEGEGGRGEVLGQSAGPREFGDQYTDTAQTAHAHRFSYSGPFENIMLAKGEERKGEIGGEQERLRGRRAVAGYKEIDGRNRSKNKPSPTIDPSVLCSI